VQEVRVQNKIPYFEAKKQVLGTTPSLFYSSIVKSKVATLTVSTQTEEPTILCPHCTSQFKMTLDVIYDRNSQSSQTTSETALPILQSSSDSHSCTAQTPVETCTYQPFNQTPVISPSAISDSASSCSNPPGCSSGPRLVRPPRTGHQGGTQKKSTQSKGET
jgi:hypothetical protein